LQSDFINNKMKSFATVAFAASQIQGMELVQGENTLKFLSDQVWPDVVRPREFSLEAQLFNVTTGAPVFMNIAVHEKVSA
jgi:hypothetical protein